MSRARFCWFIGFAVAAFFTGCGYAFQGATSILPSSVRKIYIPNVTNGTTDPRIAGFLTEALRDRFDRGGVVSVVDDLSEADAVLEVRVRQFQSGALTSSSATNRALQLDNAMVISAVVRRVSGQVLWTNPDMRVFRGSAATRGAVVTSSAEFASSGLAASDVVGLNDREVTRSQQQSALVSLVDTAARKIFEEAVAPSF